MFENQNKNIEKQLNPETIEIDGKKIEVVDMKPEYPRSEVPTFVAPGWTATPETFKENLHDMNELGRRVVMTNTPHGIAIDNSEHPEDLSEAEARKAATMMKIIEQKNLDKVDVVAHSEGGLWATAAAMMNHEKFRNLVLVNPVGIIGKDNLKRLAIDFTADSVHQKIRSLKNKEENKIVSRQTKESIKAIAKNPKQAFKQILAIANADIILALEILKKQGIGVSIIHSVDDKAFPMERAQEAVKAHLIDGFYSTKGSHNEILLKHREFSKLIDQALTDLENKEKG